MRLRTVVHFCLICVTLMFKNQRAYGSPDAVNSTNNSAVTTSTVPSNNSTKQLATEQTITDLKKETSTAPNNATKQTAAEQTVTDLKKTLQVLLHILTAKPDTPTLKLVGKIVNDILKKDFTTKDLHAKLLNELGKHAEFKKLLDDLKLDANKPENPDSEVFPALLRNAIIQEVLGFNNLSNVETETAASTEKHSSGSSTTEENPISTIQPEPASSHKESASPSYQSTNFTKLISLQQNASATTELSTTELSTTTTSSEIPNTSTTKEKGNQQANSNVTIKEIIEKILGNTQNTTKIFPYLSEKLLNTLSKYNLKYIRTYSEVVEPLSLKETKGKSNKKNKGKKKHTKAIKKPKKSASVISNICKSNSRDLLAKIIALVNDKCNTLSKKDISNQNKPTSTGTPIRKALLQNTATGEITTPNLISLPTVYVTNSTTSTVLATTRKPNRPPGKEVELTPLFPSPTNQILSTKFKNDHT